KLGVKNFVSRNLEVRALNHGSRTVSPVIRLFDGDGISRSQYRTLTDFTVVNLVGGEARTIALVEDPPASGNQKPVFKVPFDLSTIPAGMVRASVFVIDPDRQIAEGDKLDNQAGFFYSQLDPTNPTVPSTSQQPVSPIANTSGDALCDGQGRALLTVRMTARAWSDEGPAGLKEVTVKLGERVRLAYQAFNEGGVELKALQ